MVIKRRRVEDDGRRGGIAVALRNQVGGRHAPKRRREPDVTSPEKDTNRLLTSAYAYLNRVRKSFGEDKQEYEQFTQLLRQFKEKRVHVEDVVNDVADLFHAYPSLLEGFAIYLPHAYRVLHDPTHFLRPRPPACLPVGASSQMAGAASVLRARTGPSPPIMHPVPRCHIHGALSPTGMIPLAYPFVPLLATWVTGAAVATLRLRHITSDSLAAAAARRALLLKESGELTTALQVHGGVVQPGAVAGIRPRTRSGSGAVVGGLARRRKTALPPEDASLLVDALNGTVPTLTPQQAQQADAAWQAQHGVRAGLRERHARRGRIAAMRRRCPKRAGNLRRLLRAYPQPTLPDAKAFLLSIALADAQGPAGVDSGNDSESDNAANDDPTATDESAAFAAAVAAPPLTDGDFEAYTFGHPGDPLVTERIAPAIAARQSGVNVQRVRLYCGHALVEVALTRTDAEGAVPPPSPAASPVPTVPRGQGHGAATGSVGPAAPPVPRTAGSLWALASVDVGDHDVLRPGRVAFFSVPFHTAPGGVDGARVRTAGTARVVGSDAAPTSPGAETTAGTASDGGEPQLPPLVGGAYWAVAILARQPFGLSDGNTVFTGDYLVIAGTSGARPGVPVTATSLPHHTYVYIVRCPLRGMTMDSMSPCPDSAIEAVRAAALAEVAESAAGAPATVKLNQPPGTMARSDVGVRPRLPKVLDAMGRWRDGHTTTEELYVELNALLAGLPLLRYQLPQFFPGMHMASVTLSRPVGT